MQSRIVLTAQRHTLPVGAGQFSKAAESYAQRCDSGCASYSTERQLPAHHVYRGHDRGVIGVEGS
jgi:hypothetical protein